MKDVVSEFFWATKKWVGAHGETGIKESDIKDGWDSNPHLYKDKSFKCIFQARGNQKKDKALQFLRDEDYVGCVFAFGEREILSYWYDTEDNSTLYEKKVSYENIISVENGPHEHSFELVTSSEKEIVWLPYVSVGNVLVIKNLLTSLLAFIEQKKLNGFLTDGNYEYIRSYFKSPRARWLEEYKNRSKWSILLLDEDKKLGQALVLAYATLDSLEKEFVGEDNKSLPPVYAKEYGDIVAYIELKKEAEEDYKELSNLSGRKFNLINKDNAESIFEEKERSYNRMVSNLGSMPYEKRKIILVADAYEVVDADGYITLDKGGVKNINFPNGEPVSGEFYVAHPSEPLAYYPLHQADEIYVQQWIDELERILIALVPRHFSISLVEDASFSMDFLRETEGQQKTSEGESFGRKVGGGQDYHYKTPGGKESAATDEFGLDYSKEYQNTNESFMGRGEGRSRVASDKVGISVDKRLGINGQPSEPKGNFFFYGRDKVRTKEISRLVRERMDRHDIERSEFSITVDRSLSEGSKFHERIKTSIALNKKANLGLKAKIKTISGHYGFKMDIHHQKIEESLIKTITSSTRANKSLLKAFVEWHSMDAIEKKYALNKEKNTQESTDLKSKMEELPAHNSAFDTVAVPPEVGWRHNLARGVPLCAAVLTAAVVFFMAKNISVAVISGLIIGFSFFLKKKKSR